MKKTTIGMITTLLLISLLNTTSAQYCRPCLQDDLCQWDKTLPLGSQDNSGCNLNYNTYWPVNTNTIATCTFDTGQYQNYDLYISIDNDIIECTLNGETIMNETTHENCAPIDPRNGYHINLNPQAGTNTLVCQIRDRGVMSHFDACVTGTEPINAPEFSSLAIALAAILASPAFAYLLVKRRE